MELRLSGTLPRFTKIQKFLLVQNSYGSATPSQVALPYFAPTNTTMQTSDSIAKPIRTGWSGLLARAVAGVLLFELVSGLVITFGPFHAVVEWGLLLHTAFGLLAVVPMVWYLARHWKE